MSEGNQGRPPGNHLWLAHVAVRPASRGLVYFWGLLTFPYLLFAELSPAQQAQRPGGALDQAEVEPFRFEEPPADLLLDEAGVRKRKAMLLFYRGIRLEDSDMPAALKIFQKVIELDPSNLALAMETATHCAVYGRFDEAREILEKSLAENAGRRDAYLNLARFCDAHHNDDQKLKQKALDYAEQAAERFPADPVVIEFLARLLLARDQRYAAVALVEKALERKEIKDGSYWLALGNIARELWPMRNQENRQRVMQIFEMALRAEPQNFDNVERVAQFYKLSGAIERAIQLYSALVKRSPERLQAREDLADLYWQAGEHEKAVDDLEALVQINPGATSLRRKLSDMYLALKDLPNATRHSEWIVESGAGEIEDFLKLAEFRRVADRPGGALKTLRQGLVAFPDSPELSYSLGRLYLSLDRFEEAFEAHEEAERLAKAARDTFLDFAFYFDFGATAERAGKFERAEELFRKSIDLVPADAVEEKAGPLNYLGYMWLEQEVNLDEAGELIKEANQLKPDNGAYLDSLGWYYFLKKDYDEALKHLLRAEELLEDTPDSVIFEHIARCYLAKGDRDQALLYAESAAEVEPERAELKELIQSIKESE